MKTIAAGFLVPKAIIVAHYACEKKMFLLRSLRPDYELTGYIDDAIDCARQGIPCPGEEGYLTPQQRFILKALG